MYKTVLSQFVNSIVLYLPVIFFWKFVFWYGEPDGTRFILSFKVFSVVAIAHVYLLIKVKTNLDCFAFATDIWLMVCGVFAWLGQWDALRYFGQHLSVAGYWFIVFMVAIIATFWFKGGLISAGAVPPETVRIYSLIILTIIFVILIVSYNFRNETLLAAILPTILLSTLSKFYCRQFQMSNL